MRLFSYLILALILSACEREERAVEDSAFQHLIEYEDKARDAENTVMEGADARRRAIEAQEQ